MESDMAQNCIHTKEYRTRYISEFSCLYSCLVACNSKKALKAKARHSTCLVCKSFSWRLHACMYCVFIGCYNQKHIHEHCLEKDHYLSLDLNQGEVYCHVCKDYVYDFELESISMRLKRKASKLLGTKQLHFSWRPNGIEIELLKKNPQRKRIASDSFFGLRGLCNVGSSCYINCILQVMMHIPLLRNYFLSEQHVCKPADRPMCLLCELSSMVQEFYSGKSSPYVPCRFLHLLRVYCDLVRSFDQVDAHEFLGALLNLIHKQCTDMNGDGNVSSNKRKNIVDVIFNGQLQSDVICKVCESVSSTIEPFWDISIELKVANNLKSSDPGPGVLNGDAEPSLEHCLEEFTAKEELTKSSLVHCSSCNKAQISTKQLTFKKLPNMICFHLKRFQMIKDRHLKIDTFISFPQTLNMTPFLSYYQMEVGLENGNALNSKRHSDNNYSLFAVVIHIGSTDKGHYITCIRHGDQWFQCNDHQITQVSWSEVQKTEGYLLFYHRERLEYE